MTRDEFKAMLVRMVRDRKITERQAGQLLRRFDAQDIDQSVLPLPLSEAIAAATTEDIQEALAAIGLGLILASFLRREREREKLQDEFQEKAKGFAKKLIENNRTAEFESSMAESIKTHILQQTMLGKGGVLAPAEIAALNPLIQRQLGFNSRFADEITVRLLLEQGLSEKAIAHRAELYAGEGRAQFFRANEFVEGDEDTVIDYVAVDDQGTCDPCLSSEGTFLPTEGPMPGDVCLGGGFCRCKRIARTDADEARRLRGAA